MFGTDRTAASLFSGVMHYMLVCACNSPAQTFTVAAGRYCDDGMLYVASRLLQVLWLGSQSCSETVSRQLFGTLARQLIHWYAR